MAKRVENPQWAERRPSWYVDFVSNRNHGSRMKITRPRSLGYGLIYAGLGTHTWMRIEDIPNNAVIIQRMSQEEYDR